MSQGTDRGRRSSVIPGHSRDTKLRHPMPDNTQRRQIQIRSVAGISGCSDPGRRHGRFHDEYGDVWPVRRIMREERTSISGCGRPSMAIKAQYDSGADDAGRAAGGRWVAALGHGDRVPWWARVLLGLACAVLGAALVFRPFASLGTLAWLVAAAMALTGIGDLVT